MIKLVIKLVLAALVANAAWRLGSAYMQYYRFKDAVTETAQFGGDKTSSQIRQRVLELASQHEVPLAEDAVTVRRDDRGHIYVDGSYTQPVDLLPNYHYPWTFKMEIDVFTAKPPKIDSP